MSVQRVLAAFATALVCSTLVPRASAQVDVERFKPAVTHDGIVTAEGSAVRDTGDRWEFAAYMNYQRNSLVATDDSGDVTTTFVDGRAGFDLIGSATLFGPVALGLGMPFYFAQTGDGDPEWSGLGDLRIVPKVRILDHRDSFGLALAAEVRVPTNTGDFAGSDKVTVYPKAIVDNYFRNGIHIGFNLGVLLKETDNFQNLAAGSEIGYAAALGYRFGGLTGKTEIGAEAVGGIGLQQTDEEEVPLELLGYVRHHFNEDWQVLGGPGMGLIAGYGVPTWRVWAGVRFTPTSNDSDGDGISDSNDQCPNEPEDRDGQMDSDGCPEEDPDGDQDGVPDWSDDCPNAKETINGVDDEDGCPDTGDPRVIYEDGEFQVLDAVHFEHGSSEISPESYGLLDQVALMIKANPDLERVRVEGHTDATGPEEVNQRLSQSRAESVRRYMINKGVAPQRLRAVGYGESKLLVEGDSPEANAKNRRVQFFVE